MNGANFTCSAPSYDTETFIWLQTYFVYTELPHSKQYDRSTNKNLFSFWSPVIQDMN